MTTKMLLASPERLLDILDRQGSWTEEEYLSLTDHTTRLVEFTDGFWNSFLCRPTIIKR